MVKKANDSTGAAAENAAGRATGKDGRGRLRAILRGLDQEFPEPECELAHGNPLELLVATILSAQCTDERVNKVTPGLFRKYRKPGDYLAVAQEVLEEDIHSTGFYRNKAKNIQGACRTMLEKFGGNVPDTMEGLLSLPGVARKTANVVLGVAYGKAEGIVVDTHVIRLSRRLGLTVEDKPEAIERDLMAIVPRERWIAFSHQMILHGRRTCNARKPLCDRCVLGEVCASTDKDV
ncbi:MAG: endonuclease III [Acidobacteriota bacterium]|jgi:endonuclease-3|nr:endonuclease III [Acidobacteriota bacterium]